jgi:RNA polymerase sigma-70 factor (ECF subfamily)
VLAPKGHSSLGDVDDGTLARTIASSPRGAAVEAEAELYRRYAPRVRLFGLKHLRDQESAHDLAQQALLVTLERLRANDVREPDQIGSFILGTSRMLTQAQHRTERRREELRAQYAHLVPTSVEPATAPVDRAPLENCLGRLAQRDRTVLLLAFYAERPAAAIGEALAMSPGAVRVARHRALARMRECLERPHHG